MENRKLKNLALTSTLILLFLIMASNPVAAAENENNLDVQVNISEKTIIDIQPKNFAWGQGSSTVQPGTIAGPSKEQSGYGRIQLENLGSVNITEVWFNTSYPNQRPFGTGSASNYDSANFIALDSNQTDTDFNQFVNRKEYGLDQPDGKDIIYLSTPANWDYGRFRDSGQEYFWTVDDTGSLGGATFRVGVDPHNESATGSTNLDDTCSGGDESGGNTECNGYTLSTSGDWAFTDVEIGALDSSNDALPGPDGGKIYCAVMNQTQVTKSGGSESDRPAVFFIKWNKGFTGTGSGDCATATNYTVGPGGQVSELAPGGWITRNIRARVPFGVVSANLPTGNLFVLANSA